MLAAWRYLFIDRSDVYCDEIVLESDGIEELRDACDSVLDLFGEADKQDLFTDNKPLSAIFDQLLRDDEIDDTITADELRDALAIVRDKKKGECNERR